MSEKRKNSHIELALKSEILTHDKRFDYEPFLSAHPKKSDNIKTSFLGMEFSFPIWFSSMTGGGEKAKTINQNLAKACSEFGLGMGLGSLRPLLESDKSLGDFAVREFMPNRPLYGNLGIAQTEKLLNLGQESRIEEIKQMLDLDGLIVHVNPIQEWLQPEGDRFQAAPIEIIEELIKRTSIPLIVKEVGQGFGPQSLFRLMKLPLKAIEISSFGGTNFARIEELRSSENFTQPLVNVGHNASEMIEMINGLLKVGQNKCEQFILSGGVKTYLDGYYLVSLCRAQSVLGMAGELLKYATDDYVKLQKFMTHFTEGLKMAKAYLRVKEK